MSKTQGYSNFIIDSSVEQTSDLTLTANISDRWSIGGTANGGYSMAIAARALSKILPHKDPLSISGHYLNRIEPGQLLIEVEPLKIGKSISTANVRLIQNSQEKIRFLGSFTDFSHVRGETYMHHEAPDFGPIENCIKVPFKPGFSPNIELQIEKRYTTKSIWWKNASLENTAELNLYMTWPNGEPYDLYSIILFLDATTPPVFNRIGARGWVPTISLSSHIRSLPSEGPLRAIAKTQYLIDGYLEEDREIWDSEGKLVGLSRQLAKLRLPKS